ncbi:glycosyltransferase family 4 protein (plasmid) [Sulfitobacter sp. W027]|uniref:glycosyltransferase family 4 protein n=1 Tax=Sulfitobacter sp. W027 TaxID=2867025 RepID=UPI0021A4511A|nr:glycosyltransferase family 4 protein [Sulfitobacter sp. W027]UWR35727.1 glycosyltransferase family 4 protein [Sulfitobacter sp. W027]
MRILFISAYWPRPNQPHPAFFEVDQLRALVENGHQLDVWIFTPPWRRKAPFLSSLELGLDPEHVRLKQIVLPRLPELLSRGRLGTLINKLASGLRMRTCLRKVEQETGVFKAVIVNGERYIGLSAKLWNPKNTRSLAMIVHGADPILERLSSKFVKRHVGESVNPGLTCLILVGNRLRDYALRMGYAQDRIQIIPNGFRHPQLSRTVPKKRGARIKIITVARLIKVKGLDDAIQALALLQRNHPTLEWNFDILGDGPERAPLVNLTEQMGLSNRVRFHGSVPNKTVLQELEGADIFLLPSWNEAFGLVYLEAMAMGCTVIGCLENGAADILTDGVDGRLVPPRDVEKLAEVLGVLAADTNQCEALSIAARKSVKRFSWQANAEAIVDALNG